jgi:UDPglucose 6-dehydrogenase
MLSQVQMMSDPYSLADGADVLVVVTEWNEFKALDLDRIKDLMRQPVIFDARNIYDPDYMTRLGFRYRGMGRGYIVNG